MPKNAPVKRTAFNVSISIALRDRLRALSKSLGVKTSVLIDEAVMGLLAKYAEKGGIQLMSDGEERQTQHINTAYYLYCKRQRWCWQDHDHGSTCLSVFRDRQKESAAHRCRRTNESHPDNESKH